MEDDAEELAVIGTTLGASAEGRDDWVVELFEWVAVKGFAAARDCNSVDPDGVDELAVAALAVSSTWADGRGNGAGDADLELVGLAVTLCAPTFNVDVVVYAKGVCTCVAVFQA